MSPRQGTTTHSFFRVQVNESLGKGVFRVLQASNVVEVSMGLQNVLDSPPS